MFLFLPKVFLVALLAAHTKRSIANVLQAVNGVHVSHADDTPYARSASSQDPRSLLYIEGVSVSECDPPLGPIQENFRPDEESPTGFYCQTNILTCCGPLQEFNSCPEDAKQYPGKWNGGVCSGFSSKDCCFVDYDKLHEFIACYEDQEMIEGQWANGVCPAYELSDCCRQADTNNGNPDAPTVGPVFSGIPNAPTVGPVFGGGPNAPTLRPVSSGSRNAPTLRPVSSGSRSAPTPRPVTSTSQDAPTSGSSSVVLAVGIVGVLIVFAIIVAVIALRRRGSPSHVGMHGAATGNKPPSTSHGHNSTTSEAKPSAGFLDASETGTASSTSSPPETQQTSAQEFKKLSTAVKIASTLFFGGPIELEGLGLEAAEFAELANTVNVISNVAETVENVTSSINNVAEIANLAFEEEEIEI